MATNSTDMKLEYDQKQSEMQLSEEDWIKIFRDGGANAVITKKNELDNAWRKLPVVIAVIGQTGSGKSTLIRRMLDYQPMDPKGPVIGKGVNECTLKAAQYDKEGTSLTYIDLPGINSTSETYEPNTAKKMDAYAKHLRLDTIDYFILVSQNKFNAKDKLLAKYIEKMLKKSFIFVQTKMDSLRGEFGNQIIENEKGFNAVKSLIRTQIQDQLGWETNERIFLISNLAVKIQLNEEKRWIYEDSSDYEFDLLVEQIHHDMSGKDGLYASKLEAFILSTGSISKSAIQAIADTLRKQSQKWPTIAAAIGLVPIPGVSLICDSGIMIGVARDYFRVFGLNPGNFIQGQNSVEQLKNLIALMSASVGGRTTSILATAISLDAIEENVKAVPVIGCIVGPILGACTSYVSVHVVLNLLVDFCQRETLNRVTQTRESAQSQ